MNKTEKIAAAISLGMTLLQIYMYFKAVKTNSRLAKAEERIADELELIGFALAKENSYEN